MPGTWLGSTPPSATSRRTEGARCPFDPLSDARLKASGAPACDAIAEAGEAGDETDIDTDTDTEPPTRPIDPPIGTS